MNFIDQVASNLSVNPLNKAVSIGTILILGYLAVKCPCEQFVSCSLTTWNAGLVVLAIVPYIKF
jgi:hypothetical protein